MRVVKFWVLVLFKDVGKYMGNRSNKIEPWIKIFNHHRYLQRHKTTNDEVNLHEYNQYDKDLKFDSSSQLQKITYLEIKP